MCHLFCNWGTYAGGSAVNTPLYVNNVAVNNPTITGTNQTSGPPTTRYGAANTIFTVSTSTFNCPTGLPSALIVVMPPTGTVSPSVMQSAVDTHYNMLINSSITYSVNNSSTQFLHKQHAYGAMKHGDITTSDTTLVNFYNVNTTSCFGKYDDIDNLINSSSLTAANSSNAVAPTGCNIEQNHKFLNDLLIKQLTSNTYSFTSSDVNQLFILANKCPLVDGNAVYQARALYSIISNAYVQFKDSCGTPSDSTENSRRFNSNDVSGTKQILNEDSFLLFPNPNNGSMNLFYSLSSTETAQLIITDVNGKIVYKNNIDKNDSRLNISLTGLNEGVYFYKVISGAKILKSDKLIIIK